MPSFDIVSEVNHDEIRNAVQNVMREIETRFDFKNSRTEVSAESGGILIATDDDLKLRQVREILQGHLQRRGIEPGQLDYQTPEAAAGQSVRQRVAVKEGIDRELAQTINKTLKGSKLKVQVAIQGDEIRVTGKKRDDLQDAIACVKAMKNEQPVQFKNFRD